MKGKSSQSERTDVAKTLEIKLAKGFVKAIEKHPYAKLSCVLKKDESEGVEFLLKPETPQHPDVDIRKTELLCVLFYKSEYRPPEVLSLRKDFPRDLMHLNLTEADSPCSLCLFDDYNEARITLTPERLLLRIFDWLRRAAVSELHLENQPLEPFILDSLIVIVGNEVFSHGSYDSVLTIEKIAKKPIYRLNSIPINEKIPDSTSFVGLPIVTRPLCCRAIEHTPKSFQELHDILAKNDCVNLIEVVQTKTAEIFKKDRDRRLLQLKWILLLRLPKKRTPDGDVETNEHWAFLVDESIGNLGCSLGQIQREGQYFGQLLERKEPVGLENVSVIPGRVNLKFDRKLAKKVSGVDIAGTEKIVSIGAGALGSHVIMNLARQGIGRWHIIDHDHLLPHNNARHALSPNYEGWEKAAALAEEVKVLLHEKDAASSLNKSVLHLTNGSEWLEKLTDETDLMIDFSASRAVLRYLSNVDVKTRVFSFYMLKGGRCLVSLCEGIGRKERLADLEVQLNVEALHSKNIRNLFCEADESGLRYGGACSDVSTVMPQDLISIHSGIASQFIKKALISECASINVWKFNSNLNCWRIKVPVQEVYIKSERGWIIRVSHKAIELMKEYRREKFPNETGGVLVGTFDVPSKTVCVGFVLPAPPDSIEWPALYIRGVEGLKEAVEAIRKISGDCLSYVGEWHSHTRGCRGMPSSDDKKAHKKLGEYMDEEGLPAIMAIQGEEEFPNIMV